MQNKLQELTDKLYKEGLSKGKQEGEEILAKAKVQADEIVAKAKAEAAGMPIERMAIVARIALSSHFPNTPAIVAVYPICLLPQSSRRVSTFILELTI